MTLAPTEEQKNQTELETAKARIAELEALVEEQAKTLAEQATIIAETAVVDSKSEPKQLEIKDYKQGEFVKILAPGYVDKLDGRVIEFTPGKGAVIVGTGRGEFPIGDPSRIERA